MSAVEITISGVLYDKYSRTTRPVTIIGEGSLTGLGVGGGPMPPQAPVDPGYGYPDRPVDPGYGYPDRPVDPGYGIPGPPYPPVPRPQPPVQPGDPTTPVPPPPGQAGWPVQPVTPPPYITVNYPGIGPVYVAPPPAATSEPK